MEEFEDVQSTQVGTPTMSTEEIPKDKKEEATAATAASSESGESNKKISVKDDSADNNKDAHMETKEEKSAEAAPKTTTNGVVVTNGITSPKKSSPAKKKPSANQRGTSKTMPQLVQEAIVALKDRTGSSPPAVTNYLTSQYPNLVAFQTSDKLKKQVLKALKDGVTKGHLEKVKGSFKLSASFKKQQAAAKQLKQRKKKAQEMKKKKEKEKKQKEKAKKDSEKEGSAKKENEPEAKKKSKPVQTKIDAFAKKIKKDPIQVKIDALREKDPNSEELLKLLEEQKRKREKAKADKKKREEAAKRKLFIEEQMKKRKYPMEDTRLHKENKEWNIKTDKVVGPSPNLPVFFSLTTTQPNNEGGRPQRPSNKYAVAASKCEGFQDNRGLVSDLLQVYHFFRGDVHYNGDSDHPAIVPEFELKHLIHAVDDILNGTAKKARMVPPLIVHLFVTCLQILTLHPDEDEGASSAHEQDSKQRRQLQQDFCTHLQNTLSPASWADICHLYMDAMNRHSTTDASLAQKEVLLGLPIDVNYLLGVTEEPGEVDTPAKESDEPKEADMTKTELPAGSSGYLGDQDGVVARAHAKLERQDPWLLTAEELMALLRALTDDVLARKPEISEDITDRGEQLVELRNAKRAADAKFRKVKLDYEGKPKKTTKKSTTSADGKTEKGDDHKDEENSPENANKRSDDKKSGEPEPEVWKPKATLKQFERAQKTQQKANEAYDKGVRGLMARTEPIGVDRNYNAVFCFPHDPEVLYVEVVKSAASSDTLEEMQGRKTSWHVIDKKSLFDQYVESLDRKGTRERSLHDELTEQSFRRHLFDDIKVKAAAAAQIKEKEDLKRRLENAKLKCSEEEGRRSGRLASLAEEELGQVEEEIKKLEAKIKSGAVVDEELDYEELTGLELLRKFDSGGKNDKRMTRELKALAASATASAFKSMKCSELYSTGNIDQTGLLGMLVLQMLELDEEAESLVGWERTDITRHEWISNLENLVSVWNLASPPIVGPDTSSPPGSPKKPSTATQISAASEASRGSKKRPSIGGASSGSKRSKTDESSPSSLTVSQAVAKLRQPLLDLEKRIFELTGLAIAAQDVADADDNMSISEEEENAEKESKERQAWKKLINKLYHIPITRTGAIRGAVVDAIAAARKAHLKDVVGQLRSALLEFHPTAPSHCRKAAIRVLESHGGYEEDDESSGDEDEEEEETNEESPDGEDEETPSALSADAVIVNSSLDGMEDAGHNDWVNAVKSCRTLSRMATLVTSFVKKATAKLEKAKEEQDTLMEAVSVWEEDQKRQMRSAAKNGKNKSKAGKKAASLDVSEVWANVEYTDEMVMVQVEPDPFWPAKKCVVKDSDLEASLESINRCLVSLVGESGGIRVVESKNVRPFTGKFVEVDGVDMSAWPKETKTQLEDCMAMARRVLRAKEGKTKKKA